VLVVRRDWRVLQSIRRHLRAQRPDWTIECSSRAEGAFTLLARHQVDAVVTEVDLVGLDGLALLEASHAQYPEVKRVMCCRSLTTEEERRVRRCASARLTEPITVGELARALDALVEMRPGATTDDVQHTG